ncbi:MAG: XrtN system VIT domain-containing protein [Flavobacteriales bacterium]
MQTEKIFKIGFSLNLFAILFYWCIKAVQQEDGFLSSEPLFFINFVLAGLYFILIFINSLTKNGVAFIAALPVSHFLQALSLLCIAAYTLNLGMGVFEKFSTWTEIYLFAMLLPLLIIPYLEKFPVYLRSIVFFLIGAGLVLSLYFTLYLSPYFIVGIIGSLFFGVGSLLLAPLFLFVTYIVQFFKRQSSRTDVLSFLAGLLMPIIVLSVFLYQWNKVRTAVHEAHAAIITRPDNTLPQWVLLSQKIGDDFFTKTLIMGDMVYDVPRNSSDWFGLPNTGMRKLKRHDPLVFSAFTFFGQIPVDDESRLKILEFKYGGRHYTERKLWSDDNLQTSEVLTNIELYPDQRLSYTEKTISIRNSGRERWWGDNNQEALYTFHLPEGAVATSLSLWINGVEQPSRLTTKQKADSAYVNIVGVQQRDPSLLHWQEGNRITVTVFPCPINEIRVFKIGVTAPLREENALVYDNIYFEGPSAQGAMETTKISIKSNAEVLEGPSFFENPLPHQYLYTGVYEEEWSLKLKKSAVSSKGFCFNNACYQLQQMALPSVHFDPGNIYLDVNASWTEEEFNELLEAMKNKKVYVYYDEMIHVNGINRNKLFTLLSAQEFSLFPLHQIDPSNSLLITKSAELTPNLNDLKNTRFREDLEDFLKKDAQPIQLFSLNALSPYLKSLKEFQVFNTTKGDIAALKKILQSKSILQRSMDSSIVYIDEANIQIRKTDSLQSAKAPDHLLRLFAYNQLMQKIGKNYFEREKYENELFDIANEAFIASPISSMIVLETQNDYDRFGIKENKDSLGNAAIGAKGAAPEPHEWALIALATLVLLYLYRRKFKSNVTA